MRWPSWLRCRSPVGGQLHPGRALPEETWVSLAASGSHSAERLRFRSVRRSQKAVLLGQGKQLRTPDHDLAGPRGLRGPGAALPQPSPRRLFPADSERSMSDSGRLVHAHAHAAAWGGAPQPRFDPRGGASAPLPRREGRRRRPEWNSDISRLSRGLGLRLDK